MSKKVLHSPLNPTPPPSLGGEVQYLTGIPMIYAKPSSLEGCEGLIDVYGVHVWHTPPSDSVSSSKRRLEEQVATPPTEGTKERRAYESNHQAPDNIAELLLSPVIANPIYSFILGYLNPKADGAIFTTEEEELITQQISSHIGDWVAPMLSEWNMSYEELISTATHETVPDMLRYCVSYFYPYPVEELQGTLEIFTLKPYEVVKLTQDTRDNDLQN